MPFRTSIINISVPWLTGEIGGGIQYSEGTVIDAIGDWMIIGVEAAMPGIGTPDALYLVGRDMKMDRYPGDTNSHYATRLQRAIDSHRVRGNAPELLRQLEGWFFPSTDTPVRLVNSRAVWHEIDPTTLAITKTNVGDNWQWDAYAATRWWRGWVIINSAVGPWTIDLWGDPGVWGDGGVWGSNATVSEVSQIHHIVQQWTPAHMVVKNIIIVFDASLFEVSDASPPNPDGNGDDPAWRAAQFANFWQGVS